MFESRHGKLIGNTAICIYDVDGLGNNKERFVKLLSFHKIQYRYFNGEHTDKLFIGVVLNDKKSRKSFKRLLRRNKQFNGLTKAERTELKTIRRGYYLSKKYLDEQPKDSEYGIYEPIEQYSDYWFSKQCSEWETMPKGIKYPKKTFNDVFIKDTRKKVYKKQIDLILEYSYKIIKNTIDKGHSEKEAIKINEKTLKKQYTYIKKNPYKNYKEFEKYIILYGKTHIIE